MGEIVDYLIGAIRKKKKKKQLTLQRKIKPDPI